MDSAVSGVPLVAWSAGDENNTFDCHLLLFLGLSCHVSVLAGPAQGAHVVDSVPAQAAHLGQTGFEGKTKQRVF